MNTNIIYIIILAIASLFSAHRIQAQASYQSGLLPAFSLGKDIGNDFSVHFNAESRLRMITGTQDSKMVTDPQVSLTDLSFILARKTGLNNTLSGGYLLRLREDRQDHRLIQQFTYVKRYEGLRLAHRIRTDQTFGKDEKAEIRLRYRISAEIPLNGQSVDPGEWYVKLNSEYLNSWKDKKYTPEWRAAPYLGFEINDNNKLETGMDYRLSGFFGKSSRHSLWLSIGWFLKI